MKEREREKSLLIRARIKAVSENETMLFLRDESSLQEYLSSFSSYPSSS